MAAVNERSRQRAAEVTAIALPASVMAVMATWSAVRIPLWRDEVATQSFAVLDGGDRAAALSHVDAVFTLYYWLEHLATIGIPSPFGLRLASVIAAVGTVVIAGLLARKWWGTLPSLVTGFVLALNPFAVQMSATARPYALACFFVALAAFAMDRATRAERSLVWWLAYAVSIGLAGGMHLFSLLSIVPLAFLLLGASRRRVLSWLLSTVLAVAALAPVAVVAYGQRGQVSWIPRPDVRRALGALGSAIVNRGDSLFKLPEAVALGLSVVALGVGLVVLLRQPRSQARTLTIARYGFAVGLFVVPWALLLVYSLLATPYLRTAYLLPAVLGLALGFGFCADAFRRFKVGRDSWIRYAFGAALWLLLIVPVTIGAATTFDLLRANWWVDDFPGIAHLAAERVEPGDLLAIVQTPSETGVAAGLANQLGDGDLQRTTRQRLLTGNQPLVDLREVVSVRPFVTTRASRTADGTMWMVFTRGDRDIAKSRLADDGHACSVTGDDVQFGLLRLARFECR